MTKRELDKVAEYTKPVIAELVATVRQQLADQLRDEAEGELPTVARKLRAIAAEFEAGMRPGGL
jgi:hypothetical protein